MSSIIGDNNKEDRMFNTIFNIQIYKENTKYSIGIYYILYITIVKVMYISHSLTFNW